MKKTCHLTTVHPRHDTRILYKECVSLAKHFISFLIVADGLGNEIKNNVKIIDIGKRQNSRIKRMFIDSRKIFKKAIEINADIYHFHDPELLPVGLRLKNKGKKVIFDSHEFYGEQIKEKEYIPKPIRWLISSLYVKYEEYVCKRIDATIQVCTLGGKNYFGNRAKKTIFIANTPIFKDDKENIVSNKTRESITYIGGLTFNRGITNIIKAAAIANVNLILAGNFQSNKYQEELKTQSEYSVVDFKGYLTNKQIKEVLNKCFAGISTLLHVSQYHKIDTFPTKVYNYMAAGIPVILSDTEYAKKMVEKYKIGICVDPSDIEAIAKAILYLKENKNIALQMGQNGREAFEKEFHWEIEEKKLLELYNNL